MATFDARHTDAADELAVAKARAETLFGALTVGAILALGVAPTAGEIGAFAGAATSGALAPGDLAKLAAAAAWCGGATCAYTIWAQSYGQRGIAPARANLVYTTQPIFSAIFAALLLAEQPTAATCVGGALILAAVASESALLLSEEDRDARPDAP